MGDAHQAAFQADASARGMPDPAKFTALWSGQAVAVAHVAAHDLGAARARVDERDWQRRQLPAAVRELVLHDHARRSAICWNAFDD